MKRLWIGVGLLLLLLALGIGSTVVMEAVHEPISEQLEHASEAALSSHWQEAHILIAGARDRWEDCREFVACIADHAALEEADAQFARLEVLEQAREAVAFASGCAGLAALFDTLADMHDFSLWNLM